ncbi:CotH kinase family protein [Haliangium ochraceum]|uniref:CotH kinase family protein n=1 Tax=Haliangium ochraceum TaxID=80816 RepID=UPI0006A73D70|nr:CotH kinase family protein [Haliangium ochraceum]
MGFLAVAIAGGGCTGTFGNPFEPPAPPANNPDGGSGDGDGGVVTGPPPPQIFLSEIMYHPILEDDFIDRHEFIEIYNPNDEAVSLAGWSLGGGIDYTFPAGAEIAAGGYVVAAKSRDDLLSLESYALDASAVYGDFDGALANGDDTVLLFGPGGRVVDSVVYEDSAPWPEAADALGASRQFLPAEIGDNLEEHRYFGRSLERISFDLPATEVANWDVSPLDGATPGRVNSASRETPLAIALTVSASPARLGQAAGDEDPLIRAGDEVAVRMRLSDVGSIDGAEIEYFVDDLNREDEELFTATLLDDGAGNDLSAGDRVYVSTLPALPERSIVRYRVRVSESGATRRLSPRESAPYEWHAYYVSPVIEAQTRVYEVFVGIDEWTRMHTNIEARRAVGCGINPLWDERVPAVFVHEGKVYDVRARYQGSRYQRMNGDVVNTDSWVGPLPSRPDPLRALSWSLKFPRYARFEGKRTVTLNKLKQSCPGLTAGVGMRLFEAVGVPAANTRYAQLHVNGNYYRYTIEIEHPGEDMLERIHEDQAAAGEQPDQVGHLFKATGYGGSEGPWGRAHGGVLPENCGYTPRERYSYSYERKTYDWLGIDALADLIEELDAVRGDVPALRAYLEQNFDVDATLSYLAVMNWAVPFDDQFHNYYIYRQYETGLWQLMPWDLDRNFGEYTGDRGEGPASSIYIGQDGDPDNRGGEWNYFKDAFLRAFRSEFEQRLREVNANVLTPENVNRVVDEIAASMHEDEADAALSSVGGECALQPAVQQFKDFASARHAHVSNLLGTP